VSGGVLDEQGGLQGRAALVVLPAVEHHRSSVAHPETHTKITHALVLMHLGTKNSCIESSNLSCLLTDFSQLHL